MFTFTFACTYVYTFTRSYVHTFIRSYVHTFIQLIEHSQPIILPMISKDIASIIAKYNKPNVYKLHFDIQRYNIKKYIVGSSKDDVIKLIYDKRHDYNWLKWFYYYTTDYYYYGNLPSCSQHNFTIGCEKSCQRYKDFDNFDAWVKILNPNIKLIKFAFD